VSKARSFRSKLTQAKTKQCAPLASASLDNSVEYGMPEPPNVTEGTNISCVQCGNVNTGIIRAVWPLTQLYLKKDLMFAPIASKWLAE